MMMSNLESLLAFVHIPKTAGTTLHWILRSSYGSRYCEPRLQPSWEPQVPWNVALTASDLGRIIQTHPGMRAIGGHCVQPHLGLEQLVPGLRYFSMLRDPLKMRASLYQNGVMVLGADNITLEDWLAEEQSRNRQTKMIAGCADADLALEIIKRQQILVGMVEHFDESLLLLRKLMAPDLKIVYQRMRVAEYHPLTADLLTLPETRALLTAGNEEDLRLYDLIRREIYPEQRRRYGAQLDDDLRAFQDQIAPYQRRKIRARQMFKPRSAKFRILLASAPFNRWRLAGFLLRQRACQELYDDIFARSLAKPAPAGDRQPAASQEQQGSEPRSMPDRLPD